MENAPVQPLILILLIPLMSAFATPLLGRRWKGAPPLLALGATAASSVCSIFLLRQALSRGTIHYHLGGWPPPWGIELVLDPLSGFVSAVVCVLATLATLGTRASVERELPGRKARFYSVYLLLFTGLLGILVTGDVFNLYVFLEITALSAYALIAVGEDGAPLASFNYLILGTLGAGFYLLGVGYLYVVTGSLNMADLSRLLPPLQDSRVVQTALAFFLIGLFIKMGIFPLHLWLPAAYTHAPSAVSSFIAPLMTKVGAYALIRILFTVFEPQTSLRAVPLGVILTWLAAAGILAGSVLAMAQSDFRRMLAYSSVSQMGYILLGISLANATAFSGALLHILNHGLMKACLFLAAAALVFKTGGRDLRLLGRIHRRMPFTAAALAVGAFSMVGIPPTCGFFSKWYLILGSLEAGQPIFAAIILASSLLTAVYFLRVVEIVYFRPAAEIASCPREPLRDEAPLSMLIPLGTLAAGIILLGLVNERIVSGVLRFALPVP